MRDGTGNQATPSLPHDRSALARLAVQDMQRVQMRQEPPWLLPPGITIQAGQRLLDLACGSGQWALAVASRYPLVQVIGLDQQLNALRCLQERAQARTLSNVQAWQGDLRHQVQSVPAGSLALINARYLVGMVHPARWPGLLAECFALLQPGGSICLCEGGWPMTNSPTFQYATRQISYALYRAGDSFSVDGFDLGLLPLLSQLLREAGFEISGMQGLACDLAGHERQQWVNDVQCGLTQAQPLLTDTLALSEQQWRDVQERLSWELKRSDLVAIGLSLLIWARKPEEGKRVQTETLSQCEPEPLPAWEGVCVP